MKDTDRVAALFEAEDLLADERFHSPQNLRWLSRQDEDFLLHLVPFVLVYETPMFNDLQTGFARFGPRHAP